MSSCNNCKYKNEELDCPSGCSECSEWIESDESKLARFDELENRLNEVEELLIRIGNFAHDRSQGPTIYDDLWEIRSMAYEL